MKTINKIVIVQIAFIIAGVFCCYFLNSNPSKIIANHFVLSFGYLYGFWDSKN